MTKALVVVLLVATALVVVVGLAVLVLQLMRASGRLSFAPGTPAYRNHLAMARWMERQLEDDMVRVSIQPGEQAEARALLNDFYDERREIGGGE